MRCSRERNHPTSKELELFDFKQGTKVEKSQQSEEIRGVPKKSDPNEIRFLSRCQRAEAKVS